MNALRLAFGTLTILPVRAPDVDRRTAGQAMVLAPFVGLVLSLPALLLLQLGPPLYPLLVAALAVGLLAVLTRGMHLDGLADTADGLGSGRPAEEALAVMRRGDVGPFGVVTLVLVLLVGVVALAQLVASGAGDVGVVTGLVVSRLVLPLACVSGVPSARTNGLGATVVGSVSRAMAVTAVVPVVLALVVASVATDAGAGVGIAALGGVLAGLGVVLHAVRRLGGVTGDVLGASVEVAFAATLVGLCLI